jgi:hypothetical protein
LKWNLGGEITRKFIRNDYTFIKRLELIACKYEKLYYSTSKDKEQTRYSDINYNVKQWIKVIKEDMRLLALQKINDGGEWKKEYECVFQVVNK